MAGNVAIFAERIAEHVRPFSRLFRGPDGAVLAVGGGAPWMHAIAVRPSKSRGFFVDDRGTVAAYAAPGWAMVGEAAVDRRPGEYPIIWVTGAVPPRDFPVAISAFHRIGGALAACSSARSAELFATALGREHVLFLRRPNTLVRSLASATRGVSVVLCAESVTYRQLVVVGPDEAAHRLEAMEGWGVPPPSSAFGAFEAYARSLAYGLHDVVYDVTPPEATRAELLEALRAYFSTREMLAVFDLAGRTWAAYSLSTRLFDRWDRVALLPVSAASTPSRKDPPSHFDPARIQFSPQRDVALLAECRRERAALAVRSLSALRGHMVRRLRARGGLDAGIGEVLVATVLLVAEPRVVGTTAIFDDLPLPYVDRFPFWPKRM